MQLGCQLAGFEKELPCLLLKSSRSSSKLKMMAAVSLGLEIFL